MQIEVNKYNLPRQLVEFIDNNLANSKIFSLPTDLSDRKYYRVLHKNKTYVIMDSMKEPKQFDKFIKSSYFLNNHGFSVPYIHLIDFEHSIALIEDFGDTKVNNYLRDVSQGTEEEIYKKSLYLLSKLQKLSVNNLDFEFHNLTSLKNGIEEFVNNCVIDLYKDEVENSFVSLFKLLKKPTFLSLRDFHVDNLMWLDEREGINKVGLIDYQDISIGFQSYDVVSLLQDARRFVTPIFEKQMLDFFFDHNPEIDKKEFIQEYSILSIQRNLRIYGLFSKFSQRKGFSKYKKYLPNVRNYIERNVENIQLSSKVKTIIIHSLS